MSLETVQQNPQVVQLQESGSQLVESAKSIVIDSKETFDNASTVLASLASQRKQGDGLRKLIVQPLNDHVKNINAFFANLIAPVEEAENSLRQKVSAYVTEQDRLATIEQDKIDKQAAKDAKAAEKRGEPVDEFEAPAPAVAQVQRSSGRVHTTKIWTYEVTDETKIPRQFLQPNLGAIRDAVRNGERKIAGVRIYEEVTTVVR